MNSNNLLIQGIVIYTIFIIGISIVSECLCCKLKSNSHDAYIDQKLDIILENIKKELKNKYFFKMKEYMYNGKEHFEDFKPSKYDNYSVTQEDLIMQEVDKKLQGGLTNALDNHASGRKTLGQTYSKIDEWEPRDYPITSANLFKKYKKIERKIDWQDPAKLVIPPKNSYNIDYKFNYEPGQSNSYGIPGTSGEAPNEFFAKNLNTFFDDKYDPKNYKVEPLDGYSTSYTVYQ